MSATSSSALATPTLSIDADRRSLMHSPRSSTSTHAQGHGPEQQNGRGQGREDVFEELYAGEDPFSRSLPSAATVASRQSQSLQRQSLNVSRKGSLHRRTSSTDSRRMSSIHREQRNSLIVHSRGPAKERRVSHVMHDGPAAMAVAQHAVVESNSELPSSPLTTKMFVPEQIREPEPVPPTESTQNRKPTRSRIVLRRLTAVLTRKARSAPSSPSVPTLTHPFPTSLSSNVTSTTSNNFIHSYNDPLDSNAPPVPPKPFAFASPSSSPSLSPSPKHKPPPLLLSTSNLASSSPISSPPLTGPLRSPPSLQQLDVPSPTQSLALSPTLSTPSSITSHSSSSTRRMSRRVSVGPPPTPPPSQAIPPTPVPQRPLPPTPGLGIPPPTPTLSLHPPSPTNRMSATLVPESPSISPIDSSRLSASNSNFTINSEASEEVEDGNNLKLSLPPLKERSLLEPVEEVETEWREAVDAALLSGLDPILAKELRSLAEETENGTEAAPVDPARIRIPPSPLISGGFEIRSVSVPRDDVGLEASDFRVGVHGTTGSSERTGPEEGKAVAHESFTRNVLEPVIKDETPLEALSLKGSSSVVGSIQIDDTTLSTTTTLLPSLMPLTPESQEFIIKPDNSEKHVAPRQLPRMTYSQTVPILSLPTPKSRPNDAIALPLSRWANGRSSSLSHHEKSTSVAPFTPISKTSIHSPKSLRYTVFYLYGDGCDSDSDSDNSNTDSETDSDDAYSLTDIRRFRSRPKNRGRQQPLTWADKDMEAALSGKAHKRARPMDEKTEARRRAYTAPRRYVPRVGAKGRLAAGVGAGVVRRAGLPPAANGDGCTVARPNATGPPTFSRHQAPISPMPFSASSSRFPSTTRSQREGRRQASPSSSPTESKLNKFKGLLRRKNKSSLQPNTSPEAILDNPIHITSTGNTLVAPPSPTTIRSPTSPMAFLTSPLPLSTSKSSLPSSNSVLSTPSTATTPFRPVHAYPRSSLTSNDSIPTTPGSSMAFPAQLSASSSLTPPALPPTVPSPSTTSTSQTSGPTTTRMGRLRTRSLPAFKRSKSAGAGGRKGDSQTPPPMPGASPSLSPARGHVLRTSATVSPTRHFRFPTRERNNLKTSDEIEGYRLSEMAFML